MRGIYPVLILKLLNGNSPMYGYQIEKNIRILSDSNFSITEGSLYPILHKLEEKGFITFKSKNVKNRVRKYYYITAKGKSRLVHKSEEILSIYEDLKQFLIDSEIEYT